jgi:nicotinamide phosphoribosyltransferase
MAHVLANTDSYKLSHRGFMNEGTTKIYSNFTARSSRHLPVLRDGVSPYDEKAVVFGIQYFIKDYLQREWNDGFFLKPKSEVIQRFKRLIDCYLGKGSVPMEHFEALHDLGYLPIEIKALPEGACVDTRVPFLTITNTHPDFAWLTNYLETVMSSEIWKPITTATIVREYRRLINAYALKTTGSLDFTMFQAHDFSFRGMSGRRDAAVNGGAFLLSSCGTDSIPAIEFLEDYYGANIEQEFVGTSVPASEHSISCLGTSVDGELESYRKWITRDYPTGIVSLVSDTYDYWKVLTEYLPALKQDIINRPANELGLSRVVIRPDSGDPVKIVAGYKVLTIDGSGIKYANNKDRLEFIIPSKSEKLNFDGCDAVYLMETNEHFEIKDINRSEDVERNQRIVCKIGRRLSETEVKGSIELLWEIFGGTITDQGYKQLDPHIGLIYGDSITLDIASRILSRLEEKGYASTNVVFGVGSYTMNYLTRDSLGLAVKATYAEVNGVGYELFKDPITDDGVKKSARGLLRVEKSETGYVLHDRQTVEQETEGELTTVFVDGKLTRETTLSEIRERMWGQQ